MRQNFRHLFAKLVTGACAIFLLTSLVTTSAAAQVDSRLLEGLSARSIGPATVSGRIAAIDAVASDTNIIYVGAATGGVWKSVDGGLQWSPIFDDEDVASIGAVAINQAHPDIVWVGTGEGNVRNSTSIGGGVYRSPDGGASWQKLGLETTERINRIALHPTNPDIAYVAAMGTLWGQNQDRGVYRTTDGGNSWEKILYVDNTTGATDIKMDPANPKKLYAAMWQFTRLPYHFKSGGPGSGLYVSKDGGDSWRKLDETDGVPQGELGRAVFAVAPSQPRTVYALVEAKKSAIIRSDDGGETWRTANASDGIANRPFYYTELAVDTKDPNTLYNIASRVSKSIDGGQNFSSVSVINCCAGGNFIHIDTHAWWINPGNPLHMITGNDGGLGITRDGGESWRFVENLPLAQFYHVNVDNDNPYHVYGGLQDNGSFRGPAELWGNGGIRNFNWQEIGFGDGFEAVPDPEDSMQGYGMSQGGSLFRWNLRTGRSSSIRPSNPTPDIPLRFNWNAGIAQDPFDTATLYFGSQYVHKSTDRGRTWEIISGDMTTNNPDWQTFTTSGGITPDVTAAENYTTIVAIAPSTVQQGVIWVGTDDGRVHITSDGGANWASIEGRARGVPDNSWVPHIEASPHDASVAFVVFDDHRRSNMESYVYRVEDFGRRWVSLADDNIRGYALSIQQDHVDPNLLFLGTEFGLWFSSNGGDDWTRFNAGVPTVSVMDMAIQERENDLVLGTHGRSIIIIDDYSALRGLNADAFNQRLALLSVSDGQQYASRQSAGTRFDGSTGFRAPNEPRGVMLTFMASGDDLVHPDGEAERARKAGQESGANGKPVKGKVEVSDGDGNVVRTFETDVHQGVNRLVWNMRRDGNKRVRGNQPARGFQPPGAEVVPGTYSISVTLSEDSFTASVEVLADTRLGWSADDYQVRADTLAEIGALNDAAVDAVQRILDARRDIDVLKRLADAAANGSGDDDDDDGDDESENPHAAFSKQADEVKNKLKELEETFRVPPGVNGIVFSGDKIMSLVGRAFGYVGGSDGAPSATAQVFIDQAEAAVVGGVEATNALFADDVAALRAQAGELGLALLPAADPIEAPGGD